MNNLKQILIELQLNEKQAIILLSLVKIGPAGVAAIARDSGVTRTYVYGLIEELVAKGLVSEGEEYGVKIFTAVDHAGLLAYVSRQQTELQSVGKKLEQLATEFNALQVGRQQKTKVRFFDGVAGIKSIYDEIERDCRSTHKPGEILSAFAPASLEKVLPGFPYFNFPWVAGRDIVCADTFLSQYLQQMSAVTQVQHRIWPAERGTLPTDHIIWGNKVAYTDLLDYPSGIIVENAAMARTATMFFNQLWETL